MSTYLDRLKTDSWFAFANVTLLGIAGYLLVEKLSNKYPIEKNEKRFIPKLLSKLSFKKQKKEEVQPHQVFVQQKFKPKEQIIRDTSEFPIYKIVVTGGPCAGKTTAVQKIKKVFTEKGFKVMVVPQIPTMLVKSGAMIRMDRFTSANRIAFQKMLMSAAMYLEDHFTKLAAMNRAPGIVICDRGTMDPRAYISQEQFDTVLHQQGWTFNNIRDRRYDEVIFMVTAAEGAEKFYTVEGHVARHEGLQVAKMLDRKTLNGWAQHPRLNIIPNVQGESFDQKIDRVIAAVEKITGHSSQNVKILKYEVSQVKFPASALIRHANVYEVPLINNNSQKHVYEKAEKIGYLDSFTYNRVYGVKSEKGDVLETRRAITAGQFIRLVDRLKDSSQKPRNLQRISFVHKNQFFILNVTKGENEGETERILEVAVVKGDEGKVDIPEYIQIAKQL